MLQQLLKHTKVRATISDQAQLLSPYSYHRLFSAKNDVKSTSSEKLVDHLTAGKKDENDEGSARIHHAQEDIPEHGITGYGDDPVAATPDSAEDSTNVKDALKGAREAVEDAINSSNENKKS